MPIACNEKLNQSWHQQWRTYALYIFFYFFFYSEEHFDLKVRPGLEFFFFFSVSSSISLRTVILGRHIIYGWMPVISTDQFYKPCLPLQTHKHLTIIEGLGKKRWMHVGLFNMSFKKCSGFIFAGLSFIF